MPPGWQIAPDKRASTERSSLERSRLLGTDPRIPIWITSGLPTTRKLARALHTRAFVGTNPENAASFCIAGRSGEISAIVSGRLPRTGLLARNKLPVTPSRHHRRDDRTDDITGLLSSRTLIALDVEVVKLMVYCGRPMWRSKSLKRRSERKLSNSGSTFRKVRSMDRSA